MHEEPLDDETTHEMEPPQWLPPVKSPDDLPESGVTEGALCLVVDEASGTERLWTFRDGTWTPAA